MQRNVNFISWLLISQQRHATRWKLMEEKRRRRKENKQSKEHIVSWTQRNNLLTTKWWTKSIAFFSFSLSNQNKVCRHHFSVKLSIAIHRLFLMCFFSLHLLFIDSTQGFWIKIVFTIFCVRRTAHRFQLIITHFVFILFNLALIILDFSPQVCVCVCCCWHFGQVITNQQENERHTVNGGGCKLTVLTEIKFIIKLLESVINPILLPSIHNEYFWQMNWVCVCISLSFIQCIIREKKFSSLANHLFYRELIIAKKQNL